LLRELFRTQQQQLAGLDLVVRLRRHFPREASSRARVEAEMLMIQLQRCRE
jgi:RNase P protein component